MNDQAKSQDFNSIPPISDLPQPKARHDGWSAEKQVVFLEALARTGNVVAAAAYTGLSRESAYKLRRRGDAAAFALAWDAALIHARDIYQERLMERAYNGWEEPVWYGGEEVGTRTKWSPSLFLAALARLDQKADALDLKGKPARAAAGRFDELVAAIGAGQDCDDMVAEIKNTGEDQFCSGESQSTQTLMESMKRSNALTDIMATAPEDIDISDLDPEQMDDWDDLQWERAYCSGFLDRIGFYQEEADDGDEATGVSGDCGYQGL